MENEPILKVSGLEIRPRGGGPPVIGGLDIDVRRGRILGVVGESGCGKSTLCMALMNLLPREMEITGGRMTFDGVDTAGLSPEAWRRLRGRRISMVMQHPMGCFNPVRSVGSHFRETLAAHGGGGVPGNARGGGARRAAMAALAEVGLPDPEGMLRRYPGQLSGGMLQRVMIALALVNGCDLLLADEPTTALDPHSRERILDLVEALAERREMGVLLVSHDLSVIGRTADRVAVMREGRIIETGRVSELLATPAHPYTRQLVRAYLRLGGNSPLPEPAGETGGDEELLWQEERRRHGAVAAGKGR